MSKKFSALELSRLCAGSEYNYENKKAYHQMGRLILKRLADAMRLQKGEYTVRSCEGGVAVPGEIILHSDHLYLQICPAWAGQGAKIMYRSCKGQRDYTGGHNCWAPIRDLDNIDEFAEKLLSHIERNVCIAA